ncbi:MAG: hypothetical protein EXQ84_05005 [Rhodospirillaceae bacterium]|nr:hypothetical protein [Rhodospirillaceae bacterium]
MRPNKNMERDFNSRKSYRALALRNLGIFAGLVLAPPAQAQDAFADAFWQFHAASGFDYSSGYYGAPKATEILYLPVSVKASKGPWSAKVSTGWLSVAGPALLVDGGSADAVLGLRTSGRARGIADINLFGGYSIEALYPYNLFVDLTARVKAPAASFAKGLGTGRWDTAFQVDVSSVFGDFMPFAQLGYKVTGSPTGFSFRNVVYGSVGAQYTWTERVTTGVSYDVRQASLRTAATPQEGNAYVAFKLSDAWALTVYGLAGFSRNSPSAGGGLSITYRFP